MRLDWPPLEGVYQRDGGIDNDWNDLRILFNSSSSSGPATALVLECLQFVFIVDGNVGRRQAHSPTRRVGYTCRWRVESATWIFAFIADILQVHI
jgi:hypothetical protein